MKTWFIGFLVIFSFQFSWADPNCIGRPETAQGLRHLCSVINNTPACREVSANKRRDCSQLNSSAGTAAMLAREAVINPISCLTGVGVAIKDLWGLIKNVFRFLTDTAYANQQLALLNATTRAGFNLLKSYVSNEYNRQIRNFRKYLSPLRETMAMNAAKTQILNLLLSKVSGLVQNTSAHYVCLNRNERDKLVCQVAATILIPPGAAVLGKLFVKGAAQLTPRVADAVSRFTTAARLVVRRPLDTVVGNKIQLYGPDGRRLPLTSIQPDESFQAVLLRDRQTIALIRGGRRNGGHQQIAQIATRGDDLPAFEPTDLPAAGNIRFTVDANGNWRTQVGGRFYTSDHPGAAQDLSEALKGAGVPPTMVVPGRLPGWERPSN